MELPSNQESTARIITEKLLISIGYPGNILPLRIQDISQSGSKTQGAVQVGEFNIQTGTLTINRQSLAVIDTPSLVAILAHELDHFDKSLKTARAVGVEKYTAIFPHRSPSDAQFWVKNIHYANISGFDSDKYYRAIYRMANQLDMDLISSYADFYRFAEPLRNPLEVSGYSVSDRILIYYYGSPQDRGYRDRIAQIFDKIDVKIQAQAKSKSYLRYCVPALFDYYYRIAGLKLYPQFQNIYNNCTQNKKDDLTDFWLQFESVIADFYKKGQMSSETQQKVYTLLNKTLSEITPALTDYQINEIFKQKIMTMSSNLYSSKAKNYMSASRKPRP